MDRVADSPTLADRTCEGLLTVNVEARSCRGDCGQGVPVVRQGELDGVEVASAYQLAVVEVRFAVGILVCLIDYPLGLVAMALINVADGHHLDLAAGQEAVHIAGAL